MKIFYSSLLACLAISLFAQTNPFKYPQVTSITQLQNRFGIQFEDPYTQFENINSDNTLQWVDAQEKILEHYKRSVFWNYSICENMLRQSFTNFYGKPMPFPAKTRGMYFGIGYDAEMQPIVFYKHKLLDEFGQLCPTNIFQRNQNDRIYVRSVDASHDSKYVAVVISHNGSDWCEAHIRDVKNEKFLPDCLNWIKFNPVVWNQNGLFYTCYDAPETGAELTAENKNQRLMYHRLGTKTDSDKVILRAGTDSVQRISFRGIHEDSLIIVYYTRWVKKKAFSVVGYLDPKRIEEGIKVFITVPDDGTEFFDVVGVINGNFLVKSNYKAPNGHLVVYDPAQINAGQILIEQFNQNIRSASILKDRIFCTYYDDGKYVPVIFDTTGKLLKKLEIPNGLGVQGFDFSLDDSTTLYYLSTFALQTAIVEFDFKNLKTDIYDDEEVARMFNPRYITEIVYFKSVDSTRIPMYIVHDRDLHPDSSSPLLMYAYGGFGISLDPQYNPGFDLFMRKGGILAVPLIRGGGELGENWHRQGMRLKKQNSFNDFITAAEFLIANHYTSKEKLAIEGGSNGGLLVGAVMVQRPDLFKVVVPEAAVLDLVNFSRFSSGAEVGNREYGNPEDSVDFLNLYKLSPLHHIRTDVAYPATMLVASSDDDRVVPSHAFRFLACLQNNTRDKSIPYFLYMMENAGHTGLGYNETALVYAFIFKNLGVDLSLMHSKD